MPLSTIAICNRALDFLGKAHIASLDDGTPSADLCTRNLPAAREAVLRAYAWNSLQARASLPALAEAPAWGFAFAYQLPADCLRVIAVREELAQHITWRVESGRILTDATAPLNILYTRRPDDDVELDPMLADAVAARLASDIAFNVTASASRAQDMARMAAVRMQEAMRIDAIEGSQDHLYIADDWLNARL